MSGRREGGRTQKRSPRATRFWLSLLSLFALLAVIGAGPASAASGWSIVPSPDSPNTNSASQIEDVKCISASDCWAVGYYFLPVQPIGAYQTLIERWDGTSWSIVPSPNTSDQQNNRLQTVTCVSASDCWAVGFYFDATGVSQTLFERWDGTSWTIVLPAIDTSLAKTLYGVTCVSASDCWAVGTYPGSTPNRTLIQRWDGTSWTIVPSPTRSTSQQDFLEAVTCASASECWAVGHSFINQQYQTLIERWDGTSWSIVPSPNTSAERDNNLQDVTCASASDCWAVGYGSAQTLIERWDGTSWTIAPSPNTSPFRHNFLRAVTCVSPTECWAVGQHSELASSGYFWWRTLIERWDGSSWSIVPSPNTSATQHNFLYGVACVSAPDCWAIGWFFDYDTGAHTLTERYDVSGPVATITDGPAASTNATTASFSFSASEPASFACSVDAAPFAGCSSPATYSDLGEGTHTFSVRATDAAGNTSPEASWSWTVDLTAPDTTIDSGPEGETSSTQAAFSFRATEGGADFACRLDSGAWGPCTSPKGYSGLSAGSHTFDVRATDPVGNTDPTPASWTWTVDPTLPETTITSGPSGVTTSSTATFGFTASEAGSSFACSLDGGAFSACSSPTSFSYLPEGPHKFRVRATDADGNVDPTPAERTWTVDAFGPQITILRPTAGIYRNDEAILENGPQIVVIGSVTVKARAQDDQSGVASYGFEVNGMPVDPSKVTLEGGVYRFTFEPESMSEYTISARATNGSGHATAMAIQVLGIPE